MNWKWKGNYIQKHFGGRDGVGCPQNIEDVVIVIHCLEEIKQKTKTTNAYVVDPLYFSGSQKPSYLHTGAEY